MEVDSLWDRIHENHITKRVTTLKPLERELDLYYLIKLKEETQKYKSTTANNRFAQLLGLGLIS